MLFPDDTALVADSEGRLRQLVEEFGCVCKKRKLRVNESKSKVTNCSRFVGGRRINGVLNGEVLEEIERFKIFRITCCCEWRDRGRGNA